MNRLNILTVDDNDKVYSHLNAILKNNCNLHHINTGKAALKHLKEAQVDLVILTEYPEDIQGEKLLEIFKKNFPQIPVVFVVTEAGSEKIIKIFRSGARDLLLLPLNTEEVISVIEKVSGFLSSEKGKNSKRAVSTNGKKVLPGFNLSLSRFKKYISNLFNSFAAVKDFPGISAGLRQLCQENGASLILKRSTVSAKSGHSKQNNINQDQNLPHIRAFFLGDFCVYLNDVLIENWPGKKAKMLFAYLILHKRKKIHREILMNRFWPNSNAESARNCLNVTIHSIRKLLNKACPNTELLLFREEYYYFHTDLKIWLDVGEFETIWKTSKKRESEKGIQLTIQDFERALTMYRGDFLEEEIYEDWTEPIRQYHKEMYLAVLDRLSKYYSMDGKPETAIQLCEIILARDNCREDIHRRIMHCFNKIGKRDMALRQYLKCSDILKSELEIEPSDETIWLYKQIKEKK